MLPHVFWKRENYFIFFISDFIVNPDDAESQELEGTFECLSCLSHFLFFFKSYFYLFLAVPGFCCCAGFSLVARGGHSPVSVCGLLI